MKIKITCRCDYEDYYCTDDFVIVITKWKELTKELLFLETNVGKILEISYKDKSIY